MRLLAVLPLAAMGLQAPNQRAPIQRRQTARAAFSFSEAADSLKLDEASTKAADAAAKASQSFVGASSKLGAQTSDAVAALDDVDLEHSTAGREWEFQFGGDVDLARHRHVVFKFDALAGEPVSVDRDT